MARPKAGINTVPPAFFSGVRWTFAGVVLLGMPALSPPAVPMSPRLAGPVVMLSVVMISLSSIIQLYGMRQIAAGSLRSSTRR